MSYGGKKPYLFLEDSPLESLRRPTFFQKSSVQKQGLFKKPYLDEFPEWTFSLVPPKRYKSPLLSTSTRDRRRYKQFGVLNIIVLSEELIENEVGQELILKLGFEKLGTFGEPALLDWKINYFTKEAACYVINTGYVDIVENGVTVIKVINLLLLNEAYCLGDALRINIKLTWQGTTPLLPLELFKASGPGVVDHYAISDEQTFIYPYPAEGETPEDPCLVFSDDFNDNSIDIDKWRYLPSMQCFDIAEANGRIEFRHPSDPPDTQCFSDYKECAILSKCPSSCFRDATNFEVSIDFVMTVPNSCGA